MNSEKTIAGLLSAISELPDGAWIAPGYDVHNVKRILAASGVAAPASDAIPDSDRIKWRGHWYIRETAPSQPVAADGEQYLGRYATGDEVQCSVRPVAAEATAEVLDDAMAIVQDFGDAMLKRGILSGTSDAKGYAKSFDEAKAAKDAVSTYLARRLAAPVEVQGAFRIPTDDELRALARKTWGGMYCPVSAVTYARAILALAGRPAPAAKE